MAIAPGGHVEPDTGRLAVLESAATTVARIGFHETTIDDISREAGVSRASLYRWFGGRNGLLGAMLQHISGPYLERCSAIAIGPEPIAVRIEMVIAAAIESIRSMPWIRKAVRDGLMADDYSIFSEAHKSVAGRVIAAMLGSAEASGDWQPPDTVDRLVEWSLRQILLLGAEDYTGEENVRKRVEVYVMPVLRLSAGNSAGHDISSRLGAVERLLSGILEKRDLA